MLTNSQSKRGRSARPPLAQGGFMLLEALIAILIIAFGILGLIGLQASTVSAATDARHRAEATYLIDQLISQIQVGVAHTQSGVDSTALAAFAHNPDGTDCNTFDGALATSPIVTAWAAKMIDPAQGGLPGTTADLIQVKVDGAANNRVTVSVCWVEPGSNATHKQTTVAYIN